MTSTEVRFILPIVQTCPMISLNSQAAIPGLSSSVGTLSVNVMKIIFYHALFNPIPSGLDYFFSFKGSMLEKYLLRAGAFATISPLNGAISLMLHKGSASSTCHAKTLVTELLVVKGSGAHEVEDPLFTWLVR